MQGQRKELFSLRCSKQIYASEKGVKWKVTGIRASLVGKY